MRSRLWMPITSSVGLVAVGLALWPSLATTTPLLPQLDVRNPVSALVQRFLDPPAESRDLRVTNLSVHRVRFDSHAAPPKPHSEDEETLLRFMLGSAWSKAASVTMPTSKIASVVVAWDDHELAVAARDAAPDRCMLDSNQAKDQVEECRRIAAEHAQARASARQVASYELQVWVNGWGFDSLWHPANRKLVTSDPFVALHDLPPEHELSFRVRLKVVAKTGLLAGFFATETEGPWSDVVTLQPAEEHVLETILEFFQANKTFCGLIALCIGLSVLVILQLVLGHGVEMYRESYGNGKPINASRNEGGRAKAKVVSFAPPPPLAPLRHRRRSFSDPTMGEELETVEDFEQELRDLRQELADSENEVRRLMLFRGYGIEALDVDGLEQLEEELEQTLRLVRKQRRMVANPVGFDEDNERTEEEEEEEEDEDEDEGGVGADATKDLHAGHIAATH